MLVIFPPLPLFDVSAILITVILAKKVQYVFTDVMPI